MGCLVCHHVVFITKGCDVDAGSAEEHICVELRLRVFKVSIVRSLEDKQLVYHITTYMIDRTIR